MKLTATSTRAFMTEGTTIIVVTNVDCTLFKPVQVRYSIRVRQYKIEPMKKFLSLKLGHKASIVIGCKTLMGRYGHFWHALGLRFDDQILLRDIAPSRESCY